MIRNMKKKPLKIISLFAGAGGMDYGDAWCGAGDLM